MNGFWAPPDLPPIPCILLSWFGRLTARSKHAKMRRPPSSRPWDSLQCTVWKAPKHLITTTIISLGTRNPTHRASGRPLCSLFHDGVVMLCIRLPDSQFRGSLARPKFCSVANHGVMVPGSYPGLSKYRHTLAIQLGSHCDPMVVRKIFGV